MAQVAWLGSPDTLAGMSISNLLYTLAMFCFQAIMFVQLFQDGMSLGGIADTSILTEPPV